MERFRRFRFRLWCRRHSQGYAAILCNRGGNLGGYLQKRGAILILPQKRQHLPAEAAYLAIGKNGLKAVPNFGPVLMFAYREQHHDAAVFAFRSNAPFLEEPVGKILSRIAFERADRYDGELSIRLLIQLFG